MVGPFQILAPACKAYSSATNCTDGSPRGIKFQHWNLNPPFFCIPAGEEESGGGGEWLLHPGSPKADECPPPALNESGGGHDREGRLSHKSFQTKAVKRHLLRSRVGDTLRGCYRCAGNCTLLLLLLLPPASPISPRAGLGGSLPPWTRKQGGGGGAAPFAF